MMLLEKPLDYVDLSQEELNALIKPTLNDGYYKVKIHTDEDNLKVYELERVANEI